MGAGLLSVKSGFVLFIKNYQFPLQINTLERERDAETVEVEHYFDEYDENEKSYVTVQNEEEPVSCLCATILVGVKTGKGKGPQGEPLELRIHIQHHSRLKNEASVELVRIQSGDLFQFEITMSKVAARNGEALFARILAESHVEIKKNE
jgi:hypothetical protein